MHAEALACVRDAIGPHVVPTLSADRMPEFFYRRRKEVFRLEWIQPVEVGF